MFTKLVIPFKRGVTQKLVNVYGAKVNTSTFNIEIPWYYPNNTKVLKDFARLKLDMKFFKENLAYPKFQEFTKDISRLKSFYSKAKGILNNFREAITIDYTLQYDIYMHALNSLEIEAMEWLEEDLIGGEHLLINSTNYQKILAVVGYYTRRFCFFLEPGLGKTKIAIDIHNLLGLKGAGSKTLVVCPAGLKKNWENEFRKKVLNPNHKSVKITNVNGKSRAKKLEQVQSFIDDDNDVIIVAYASMKYVVERIDDLNIDTLFLDESHKTKNSKSRISKNFAKISNKIENKYILTGTPVLRSPEDLYAQINVLGQVFTEPLYSFKSSYMTPHPYVTNAFIGSRNLDKLYERIKYVSITIEKKQLLTGLPERFIEKYVFDAPDEQRTFFRKIMDKNIAMMDVADGKLESQIMLVSNNYAQQISGGALKYLKVTPDKLKSKTDLSVAEICAGCKVAESCKKNKQGVLPYEYDCIIRSDLKEVYGGDNDLKETYIFEDNPKLDWLRNYIPEKSGKIIIFAAFLAELTLLENLLKELNIEYIRIDGSNTEKRVDMVEEFNKSKKIKVLVSQVQTAVGYNATSATTYIYYSVGYKLDNWLQSRDRAYRFGQTKDVTEIRLVMNSTLEEKVWQSIAKKNSISNLITKNREAVFYEELLTDFLEGD